ncbi:CHRD domain-containing protein [Qipengyuania sp.]|uniref:CHRD domain-containing protein n=1 Tax=Qipengyuania sp. TaxID=2004515 RepID=UPI003BA8C3B0
MKRTGMHGARMARAAALLGGLALACASPVAAQDDSAVVGANLYGEYVVGKGAGEEASGAINALIEPGAGRMCYYLEASGLEGIDAAHIHEGREGRNGPVVATLEMAPDDEVCVTLDPALLRRIAADPEDYYADIHTSALPDGALRGQLSG